MNFSLNSDDPLVCQTRIDLEQGVAFNEIGLSPAEITRAVRYVMHLTFSLKAILETFSLWTKSYGATIQMKPFWQYFRMTPFVFQYFTK